jgi:streptogramin lyase
VNRAIASTGITAGPDGALWFASFNGDVIGRITTGHTPAVFSHIPGIPTLSAGAIFVVVAMLAVAGALACRTARRAGEPRDFG